MSEDFTASGREERGEWKRATGAYLERFLTVVDFRASIELIGNVVGLSRPSSSIFFRWKKAFESPAVAPNEAVLRRETQAVKEVAFFWFARGTKKTFGGEAQKGRKTQGLRKLVKVRPCRKSEHLGKVGGLRRSGRPGGFR